MDPKKQSSFEFGYSLGEQLILPQIRSINKNGLTANVIRKIEIVTDEVNANVENPEPNKPGQCRICLDTIKGPSCKTLKKKDFVLDEKAIVVTNIQYNTVKFVHSYFMTIFHPKRPCIIFTLHIFFHFP